MKFRRIVVLYFLSLSMAAQAGTYDSAAQSAAQWLESQQDVSDGSWGSTPVLKQLHTVSSVRALYAYNRRNVAYYAGLAWIKNHDSGNNDYLARRAILLTETGASTVADSQNLLASQRIAFPGNNGWGVTAAYNGSALDTAFALQAIKDSGLTFDATTAIAFLKSTQLTGTDKGWSISQNTTSDAITNAQSIIALSRYLASDASLVTPLANAVATLTAQVTASSPVQLRALAAQALLLSDPASVAGKALLNGLTGQQTSGNWGGDIYATAAVLQAMAVADAKDLASQRIRINMPDENLRNAVNLALGRGAMDQLNRGELAKLTNLNISNLGVASLTGLEYATSLTTLTAVNNNIADTTPISTLAGLTHIDLNGNPCSGCTIAVSGVQVPVPDWALIVMAAILLTMLLRNGKSATRLNHSALVVLAAAMLHAPIGFGQSLPLGTAVPLNSEQHERLQKVSGQILQAYATREDSLKQEAETLREQLQPMKDALTSLENQLKQDIRQHNQAAVSQAKQLITLQIIDLSPRSVDLGIDLAHPGKPLKPNKPLATPSRVLASQPVVVQANSEDESQPAHQKRAAVLEHIASLRNGQLAPTHVIDHKVLEGQLDGLRDQLEGLQGEPGQMLVKVKHLSESLNPPEPPPYIKPSPTYMVAPDIHPESKPKSTRK